MEKSVPAVNNNTNNNDNNNNNNDNNNNWTREDLRQMD